MKVYTGYITLFGLLLTALTVKGETRAPIEEVFQSELVYPQEKGEIQLTSFPRFSHTEYHDMGAVPVSLEYGLTNRWQLELEWTSFISINDITGNSVHGIGDLEISSKYSFLNIGQTGFHTALAAEAAIPLGDEEKGLGYGELSYGGFIVAAKDLKSINNAQLFTQIGMETEDGESETAWNVGFFFPTSNIILTGEYNWTEEASYITPGFVFRLPGEWQMGIGVPIGTSESSDTYQIVGLVTYEFHIIGADD